MTAERQYRSWVYDGPLGKWMWSGWEDLDDPESVPFPSEFRDKPSLKVAILRDENGNMNVVRGNDVSALFRALDESLSKGVTFTVQFKFE